MVQKILIQKNFEVEKKENSQFLFSFFFQFLSRLEYHTKIKLRILAIFFFFLQNLQDSQPLDEDVLGERQRVESLMRDWHQKSDVLLVHNLYKQFGNRGLVAVNNLTFGVKNGECFGLLGVNGAGKTTSFR